MASDDSSRACDVLAAWALDAPASISALARRASIHRTTAHYHLARLLEQGHCATARAGRETIVLPAALSSCDACLRGVPSLLTGAGLVVACILADTGPLAQRPMAALAHLGRGAVRGALHRLQRSGLVGPAGGTPRRRRWALTRLGQHCLEAVVTGVCDTQMHIDGPESDVSLK